MSSWIRYLYLVSTLALSLTGCALLRELPDAKTLIEEGEEQLPLAPIGGVPIELVAEVELGNRETADGMELVASTSLRDVLQEYLRDHQNRVARVEGRLVYR